MNYSNFSNHCRELIPHMQAHNQLVTAMAATTLMDVMAATTTKAFGFTNMELHHTNAFRSIVYMVLTICGVQDSRH